MTSASSSPIRRTLRSRCGMVAVLALNLGVLAYLAYWGVLR